MKKSAIMILSLLLSIFSFTGCGDFGDEKEIPKLHLIRPEESFVKKITTTEGVDFSCSSNYSLGIEAITGQFCYKIDRDNPGNMDLTINCNETIDYVEFYSFRGMLGTEKIGGKQVVLHRQFKENLYDSFILYITIEGVQYQARFYLVGVG